MLELILLNILFNWVLIIVYPEGILVVSSIQLLTTDYQQNKYKLSINSNTHFYFSLAKWQPNNSLHSNKIFKGYYTNINFKPCWTWQFNINSISQLYSTTCNKLNSLRHFVKHQADKFGQHKRIRDQRRKIHFH